MVESSKGVPQFATAEFAPNSPTSSCTICKLPIPDAYYTVNGAKACSACARNFQGKAAEDSHAAFVRGLTFGIGGAIAGFALYVGFALLTGLVFGYISLAVGFIVGKAMHYGSGGVGGRRYQLAAAMLTYLAVSLSALPLAFHEGKVHRAQTQSAASTPHAPMGVAKAIGVLVLVGVASPVLALQNPLQGVIGLVILYVGIRFAWRFTAGTPLVVSGPYSPPVAGVI